MFQDLSDYQKDRMLVCWVAKKNLPYSFFDDIMTQNCFQLITKNVKMPKRKSLKIKVLEHFAKMKTNLKKILDANSSKFSFTIDGWSGINGKSYYSVTVHFIDEDWILQSIVLDFIPSKGKHTGAHIAKIFLKSLKSFSLKTKIQGITVDNTASNTTFMHELQLLLEEEDIEFDEEDQHFRCMSHILNLGVQTF